MTENSNTNMRSNAFYQRMDNLEKLINNKCREQKPHWYNKNRNPTFNEYTNKVLERICFGEVGGFEYYGIPFQLYGEKTTAFYKAKNKSIYHIQVQNNELISFYKFI